MLSKISKNLRTLAIVVVSVLVVLKITEEEKKVIKSSKGEFQTEEFDDIW